MVGARPIVALLLALAVAAPNAACQDPLPRRSIIVDLRLLAIVGDPPEALPGQTVQLSALVVDPEERPITYEWAACVVPTGADDDDPEYDKQDCLLRLANGESGVTHLGTGETAEYTVPEDFFDDSSVVSEVYGFGE